MGHPSCYEAATGSASVVSNQRPRGAILEILKSLDIQQHVDFQRGNKHGDWQINVQWRASIYQE